MKKLPILGIVAALLLTATACGQEKPKQTNTLATAKVEEKQTVEAFGVIKVNGLRNINVDFPAAVLKVNVREGQRIHLGETLVTLDIADYRTQIANKELDLTTAKNELERIKSDLATRQGHLSNSSNPDIKKLLNDKRNAEALYSKAKAELQSKESLYTSGALSRQELEDYKKIADARKKDTEDIVFTLDSRKYGERKEVDTLKTSFELKTAQITALEAELSSMKAKLNRSYIKDASIVSDIGNGVCYEIGYVQGDIVSPVKKVLSVMDLDTMVVEANVSEEFIKDVQEGASVTISPQADKTKTYKGKVTSISEKAVQKNGETNVPVQISIDDRDEFLLPEFNVDVNINIEKQ
jgi:HlyD family secretion protein